MCNAVLHKPPTPLGVPDLDLSHLIGSISRPPMKNFPIINSPIGQCISQTIKQNHKNRGPSILPLIQINDKPRKSGCTCFLWMESSQVEHFK